LCFFLFLGSEAWFVPYRPSLEGLEGLGRGFVLAVRELFSVRGRSNDRSIASLLLLAASVGFYVVSVLADEYRFTKLASTMGKTAVALPLHLGLL